MIMDAAAISAGAIAGALCRYQIGNVAARKIAEDPARLSFLSGWHTAGINVFGSFVLGIIAGTPNVVAAVSSASGGGDAATATIQGKKATATIQGKKVVNNLAAVESTTPCGAPQTNSLMRGMSPRSRLMAGIGFCGSFTTFSTFSVEVVTMMGKGEMFRAASFVAVNNVGGIGAAFAGVTLARRIFR